jgi:hypothetical protein
VVQELKVLLRVATKHPQKVELLDLSTMFLTFLLTLESSSGAVSVSGIMKPSSLLSPLRN